MGIAAPAGGPGAPVSAGPGTLVEGGAAGGAAGSPRKRTGPSQEFVPPSPPRLPPVPPQVLQKKRAATAARMAKFAKTFTGSPWTFLSASGIDQLLYGMLPPLHSGLLRARLQAVRGALLLLPDELPVWMEQTRRECGGSLLFALMRDACLQVAKEIIDTRDAATFSFDVAVKSSQALQVYVEVLTEVLKHEDVGSLKAFCRSTLFRPLYVPCDMQPELRFVAAVTQAVLASNSAVPEAVRAVFWAHARDTLQHALPCLITYDPFHMTRPEPKATVSRLEELVAEVSNPDPDCDPAKFAARPPVEDEPSMTLWRVLTLMGRACATRGWPPAAPPTDRDAQDLSCAAKLIAENWSNSALAWATCKQRPLFGTPLGQSFASPSAGRHQCPAELCCKVVTNLRQWAVTAVRSHFATAAVRELDQTLLVCGGGGSGGGGGAAAASAAPAVDDMVARVQDVMRNLAVHALQSPGPDFRLSMWEVNMTKPESQVDEEIAVAICLFADAIRRYGRIDELALKRAKQAGVEWYEPKNHAARAKLQRLGMGWYVRMYKVMQSMHRLPISLEEFAPLVRASEREREKTAAAKAASAAPAFSMTDDPFWFLQAGLYVWTARAEADAWALVGKRILSNGAYRFKDLGLDIAEANQDPGPSGKQLALVAAMSVDATKADATQAGDLILWHVLAAMAPSRTTEGAAPKLACLQFVQSEIVAFLTNPRGARWLAPLIDEDVPGIHNVAREVVVGDPGEKVLELHALLGSKMGTNEADTAQLTRLMWGWPRLPLWRHDLWHTDPAAYAVARRMWVWGHVHHPLPLTPEFRVEDVLPVLFEEVFALEWFYGAILTEPMPKMAHGEALLQGTFLDQEVYTQPAEDKLISFAEECVRRAKAAEAKARMKTAHRGGGGRRFLRALHAKLFRVHAPKRRVIADDEGDEDNPKGRKRPMTEPTPLGIPYKIQTALFAQPTSDLFDLACRRQAAVCITTDSFTWSADNRISVVPRGADPVPLEAMFDQHNVQKWATLAGECAGTVAPDLQQVAQAILGLPHRSTPAIHSILGFVRPLWTLRRSLAQWCLVQLLAKKADVYAMGVVIDKVLQGSRLPPDNELPTESSWLPTLTGFVRQQKPYHRPSVVTAGKLWFAFVKKVLKTIEDEAVPAEEKRALLAQWGTFVTAVRVAEEKAAIQIVHHTAERAKLYGVVKWAKLDTDLT
jgi:hypothetical protein